MFFVCSCALLHIFHGAATFMQAYGQILVDVVFFSSRESEVGKQVFRWGSKRTPDSFSHIAGLWKHCSVGSVVSAELNCPCFRQNSMAWDI